MQYKIAVIPGDGIGPEVTGEAVKALDAVGRRFGHQFDYEYVGRRSCHRPGRRVSSSKDDRCCQKLRRGTAWRCRRT